MQLPACRPPTINRTVTHPCQHTYTHARSPDTPTMLDYKIHADNGSMYNTPPCWTIYICGLVFKHLLKLGGLEGE